MICLYNLFKRFFIFEIIDDDILYIIFKILFQCNFMQRIQCSMYLRHRHVILTYAHFYCQAEDNVCGGKNIPLRSYFDVEKLRSICNTVHCFYIQKLDCSIVKCGFVFFLNKNEHCLTMAAHFDNIWFFVS